MDWFVGILGVVLTVVGCYLVIRYREALDWSEFIFMPPWLSVVLVVGCAVAFIGSLVVVVRRAAQA
jgi:hypothetical protein